ncbi:MAG: hypothetical protein V4480_04220 [Patescibacteria group bacterium]
MHARSNSLKGFTVAEVMLVIGLIALLGGMTAVEGFNAYRRALTRTDAERIFGLLRRARSDSIHGVCLSGTCTESPFHGVSLSAHGATLFEGSDFKTRSQSVDETLSLEGTGIASSTGDILFAPLTGKADKDATVTLADPYGARWDITVYASGAIDMSLQDETD